jgi:hypothetical protein
LKYRSGSKKKFNWLIFIPTLFVYPVLQIGQARAAVAAWAGSQARGMSGRVRVSGQACMSGPAGRGSSEFTYFRWLSSFSGTMVKTAES